MSGDLLEVRDLRVRFRTAHGVHDAVRDVSFSVRKGETLGVVGESGSGKSVTALSLMRLIPNPPGEIVGGEVRFLGRDLLKEPMAYMRTVRGNEMSMIFQEPMTSLNPVKTCGDQIMEPLVIHGKCGKDEARGRAMEYLRLVGIPSPEQRFREYPHQMSGGMRQRVMIAMALVCNPKLILADEPTTALDVTIQAQILELMKELRERVDASIVMITHDLGVIADICHNVVVMYAGQVVETGPIEAIFEEPLHPYTQALLLSIPKIGGVKQRLFSIEGTVPNPFDMPPGCAFERRCVRRTPHCGEHMPSVCQVGDGRSVRCWLHAGVDVEANADA